MTKTEVFVQALIMFFGDSNAMPLPCANWGYLYLAQNQAFAPLKFPHKASGWHFICDEITELKVEFVVRPNFEIGWSIKIV